MSVESRESKKPFRVRRVFAALVAPLALTLSACAPNSVEATPQSQSSSTANPSPETASPTAEATTTTPEASPTPELPFNPDAIAVMKEESTKEFTENGRTKRIGYYLSDAYNQVYVDSEYGDMLNQELANGIILYEYNPFYERTLGSNAKGQDVLNAYLFGELFVVAHKDPDEAEKLVSGIVDDPKSEEYKETVKFVRQYAGTEIAESTVRDTMYQVADFKRYSKENESGEKDKYMTVYATGGIRYDFIFVPVEGLATANYAEDDDDKEKGLWLLKSSKVGKVSIDYDDESGE